MRNIPTPTAICPRGELRIAVRLPRFSRPGNIVSGTFPKENRENGDTRRRLAVDVSVQRQTARLNGRAQVQREPLPRTRRNPTLATRGEDETPVRAERHRPREVGVSRFLDCHSLRRVYDENERNQNATFPGDGRADCDLTGRGRVDFRSGTVRDVERGKHCGASRVVRNEKLARG